MQPPDMAGNGRKRRTVTVEIKTAAFFLHKGKGKTVFGVGGFSLKLGPLLSVPRTAARPHRGDKSGYRNASLTLRSNPRQIITYQNLSAGKSRNELSEDPLTR